VKSRKGSNGDRAPAARPERAYEHPCELAADGLFQATESGSSGVVDLDQGSAEEVVASLALR
jgi:hypothetical protein